MCLKTLKLFSTFFEHPVLTVIYGEILCNGFHILASSTTAVLLRALQVSHFISHFSLMTLLAAHVENAFNIFMLPFRIPTALSQGGALFPSVIPFSILALFQNPASMHFQKPINYQSVQLFMGMIACIFSFFAVILFIIFNIWTKYYHLNEQSSSSNPFHFEILLLPLNSSFKLLKVLWQLNSEFQARFTGLI